MNCSYNMLPPELLNEIFMYLTSYEKLQIALSTPRFHVFTKDTWEDIVKDIKRQDVVKYRGDIRLPAVALDFLENVDDARWVLSAIGPTTGYETAHKDKHVIDTLCGAARVICLFGSPHIPWEFKVVDIDSEVITHNLDVSVSASEYCEFLLSIKKDMTSIEKSCCKMYFRQIRKLQAQFGFYNKVFMDMAWKS